MWKLANKPDQELVSCERALPEREGVFIGPDGCCRLALSLAPPALACGILIGLQDTWFIKARAHSALTRVGWLILTVASSVLSVMKGHLQGLIGNNSQNTESRESLVWSRQVVDDRYAGMQEFHKSMISPACLSGFSVLTDFILLEHIININPLLCFALTVWSPIKQPRVQKDPIGTLIQQIKKFKDDNDKKT